jgi:hypothetical protein
MLPSIGLEVLGCQERIPRLPVVQQELTANGFPEA